MGSERRRYKREKRRFGELLQAHRLHAGFKTQGELSIAAGISSASEVSNAEHGDVSDYLARRLIAAIRARYPLRWDEMQDLATAFLFPDEVEHESSHTNIIGLVVAAIDYSPFWAKFAGAAEREAAKYGYILTVGQHYNELERQREYLALLMRKRPLAGLLIAPAFGVRKSRRDAEYEAIELLLTLNRQRVPIVFLDREPPISVPFPCVRADHAYMARAAVEELRRNGHRRIGAIFGPRHAPAYQEQYRGFVDAMKEFGTFPDEKSLGTWLRRWVAWGEDPREGRRELEIVLRGHTAGREVAMRLLSQPGERPTAMICGTASLALETLRAVRDLAHGGLHLSVPRDLSLIASESAPSLEWSTPAITSVDYGLDTLAARALAKLVALIEHPEDEQVQRGEPAIRTYEIIQRDSIRVL